MIMPLFDWQLPIGWKQIAVAIGIPTIAGLVTYALWKRETESESNGIIRSEFHRIEVNVPGDKVGAVIGKSGAVVREIEQTSGARVRVSAKPLSPSVNYGDEEDGVVTIQGYRDNVLAAEIAVRKVIAQTGPVVAEIVYVPKWSIGFIIGKKGASIRELSYVSGAKIVIGRSGNDMEMLTIRGRPQAIDTAKMWLEKKVKDAEETRGKWKQTKQQRQNEPEAEDETSLENTQTETTTDENDDSAADECIINENQSDVQVATSEEAAW